MSQAASQAAAFYRDVADHGAVWTLRDASGYPAPANSKGQRAQPFWSSRPRAERVIDNVQAYSGFEVVEIGLDAFIREWIPKLSKRGILVGVNWSGPRATGYDVEPETVREAVLHALSRSEIEEPRP